MNGLAPPGAGTQVRPSLLLALTTTSVLVLVPLGVAWAVQILSPAHDLVLSIAAGMLASLTITWLATTLWSRTTRAGERVFGDVTLLGLLRYQRANRQVNRLEAVMADRATITSDEARRTMMRLADALERRDLRTHGHSRRVARHSAAIAREMGLPAEEIARIRFAAAMHDIGKLNIPEEILLKPDKLTKEEFEIVKRHPVDSAKMVEVIDDPALVAIIRGHHERWDGGGYPDNLAGTQIPLGARIIAVADTFDAMVSDRPYSEAAAHKKSREVIAENSGSQFDPQVADAFRQYYRGGNWHVAWGAVSALPPRFASLLGDLLRGGIPAASAAPAVAAVAIAVTGVVSVGGLPGTSNFQKAGQSGSSAVAVVVGGSDDRAVKLDGGRVVSLPEGVRMTKQGVTVDPSGRPVDLTKTEHTNVPATGSAAEATVGNSNSAPGSKPSELDGESSETKSDTGDELKETTTKTTDKSGKKDKDVSEKLDKVAEQVKEVGAGDATDHAADTVKKVADTVKETGEAGNKTGEAVGGGLGGKK
ncbi:MAG: HD-GYP domain-containing protein [Solirubrobacterales bacterium]|nr:HD-GYP domain-containing protein [Solirubrobacterales bacterium]